MKVEESIQFKDIPINGFFKLKDVVWKKLCENTAIPKGYKCSNSIPSTAIVEIYNEVNKRWESTT